ncbi:MAG: hypothetical protein A3A30_02405 [Candidatus Terrybacteria bacterium RIFCSPLOWO2_01_FULL_48_14]|nr:MAG: hypothetical protein A3A30_02405 [Candidatus Terrybacteria bacterium RIFCSPLOWO2_01_FULL_48_14]
MEKASVLLIEDDPFLTRAYQVKFESEGITLATATNGEEGLAAMRAQKPKLILLDLMMPKKSGFDVLKEMQQDPGLKDIPVIVLTVLGREEDVRSTLELGAKEYFIKTETKLDDVIKSAKKYLPSH